uniref:Uncharacterized protein n=1 Tax=Sphaerodactylus townsendi TaxID=933632 RepID=A0ACB8F290_9SAUR
MLPQPAEPFGAEFPLENERTRLARLPLGSVLTSVPNAILQIMHFNSSIDGESKEPYGRILLATKLPLCEVGWRPKGGFIDSTLFD